MEACFYTKRVFWILFLYPRRQKSTNSIFSEEKMAVFIHKDIEKTLKEKNEKCV